MDETYIKVKGNWVYLYRAVDKEGKTVDFKLPEKRDELAASAFFEKAISSNSLPDKVTMNKSGANEGGIDTINLHLALLFMLGGLFVQLTVRQIKYLNNIMEQDHRFIKKITKPMRGFKAFHSANATELENGSLTTTLGFDLNNGSKLMVSVYRHYVFKMLP